MIQNTDVLVICVLACLHQAMGSSQVTGYVGQSVVLKSGADPSWNLLKIQWSIYSNTTYIITCVNGKIENRSWRYQDRLTLNKASGDLEIHNLTAEDSMKYTVSLLNDDFKQHENHIALSVQESLKKPTISVLFSFLDKEYCVIALRCSSSEDNVTLSWTPTDGFTERYSSRNVTQSSTELWTYFKPNRNVTFTCTAMDNNRTSSDLHTVSCPEINPKPVPTKTPTPTPTIPSKTIIFRHHTWRLVSLCLLILTLGVLLIKISLEEDHEHSRKELSNCESGAVCSRPEQIITLLDEDLN